MNTTRTNIEGIKWRTRFNAAREAKWRAAGLIRYALLDGFRSLDERYGEKAHAVRRELAKLAGTLERRARKTAGGEGASQADSLNATENRE